VLLLATNLFLEECIVQGIGPVQFRHLGSKINQVLDPREVIFVLRKGQKGLLDRLHTSRDDAKRVIPGFTEEASDRTEDVAENRLQPGPGKPVCVAQAILDGGDVGLNAVKLLARSLAGELDRGRDLERIERFLVDEWHLGQDASRDTVGGRVSLEVTTQIIRALATDKIGPDSETVKRDGDRKPDHAGGFHDGPHRSIQGSILANPSYELLDVTPASVERKQWGDELPVCSRHDRFVGCRDSQVDTDSVHLETPFCLVLKQHGGYLERQ
jgi:hypothetical protein